MKHLLTSVFLLLLLSLACTAQYTPLPKLDQSTFNAFKASLKSIAETDNIPELHTIADNLSYDEARQFMANPQSFIQRLNESADEQDRPELSKIRLGIIVSLLYNHFSGILDGYSSAPGLGYTFGMYVMYTVASFYFIAELSYAFRSAGEKSSGGGLEFRFSSAYINLILTALYVLPLENMRLLLGGGPIMGFGLSGKRKADNNGQVTENDMEFADNGLRRAQMGINLTAGIELRNQMIIFLGYQFYLNRYFGGDNSKYKMNAIRLGLMVPFSTFTGRQ